MIHPENLQTEAGPFLYVSLTEREQPRCSLLACPPFGDGAPIVSVCLECFRCLDALSRDAVQESSVETFLPWSDLVSLSNSLT
jgi:hypothetical protein